MQDWLKANAVAISGMLLVGAGGYANQVASNAVLHKEISRVAFVQKENIDRYVPKLIIMETEVGSVKEDMKGATTAMTNLSEAIGNLNSTLAAKNATDVQTQKKLDSVVSSVEHLRRDVQDVKVKIGRME